MSLILACEVIESATRNHVSSDAAYENVQSATETGGTIADGTALTIASWWQSPDRVGSYFAQLSTTGIVSLGSLLDAIAVQQVSEVRDLDALNALGLWALRHPSRAILDHGDLPAQD